MSDSGPVLTAAETELTAGLLAAAWREHPEISAAELIWNRRHIVRLRLGSGRTAVLNAAGTRPWRAASPGASGSSWPSWST